VGIIYKIGIKVPPMLYRTRYYLSSKSAICWI